MQFKHRAAIILFIGIALLALTNFYFARAIGSDVSDNPFIDPIGWIQIAARQSDLRRERTLYNLILLGAIGVATWISWDLDQKERSNTTESPPATNVDEDAGHQRLK